MASDLMSYLVGEKVVELEQDRAAMYRALQDAVADTVALRFPNTPTVLVRNVQFLNDLDQVVALRRAVLQAPDQPAVEALLAAMRTEGLAARYACRALCFGHGPPLRDLAALSAAVTTLAGAWCSRRQAYAAASGAATTTSQTVCRVSDHLL